MLCKCWLCLWRQLELCKKSPVWEACSGIHSTLGSTPVLSGDKKLFNSWISSSNLLISWKPDPTLDAQRLCRVYWDLCFTCAIYWFSEVYATRCLYMDYGHITKYAPHFFFTCEIEGFFLILFAGENILVYNQSLLFQMLLFSTLFFQKIFILKYIIFVNQLRNWNFRPRTDK